MAYWLDDGFDTWPETIRAGKAAAGLYVCCGVWIARNISNGTIADAVVPAEVATMYGTPEWVTKLVAVGLWVTEEVGHRDVRYFGMGNPTAEVVRQRKAQAAERQRRFRNAKKGVTPSVTRDERVSSTVSHSSPALPPLKGVGGAGAGARRLCKTCANPMDSPYHRNVCRMGKTA